MFQVLIGISLHAVGACCASLCYVPQKRTTGWSWQTYWLAQAVVCWVLMPIIGALITIPHLFAVLSEAPTNAMLSSFLLGMAYGIGGTAFGIAIRYVGFSLTYAIAVGISCVFGTLLPPLVHGTLSTILSGSGSTLIMIGIAIGAMGIALCGLAGRSKEKGMIKTSLTTFSLAKGLPLCFLAGILSAVYGFALDQGQPIAAVAAKYGAGNFQGNVIFLFANTGAFCSTLIYCLYLHKKNHTFKEYLKVPMRKGLARGGGVIGVASQHNVRLIPADDNSPETVNIAPDNQKQGKAGFYFLMSALTGVLWYSQFFFYLIAHIHMGNYKFTSWAIHMIMLVLFSTVAGLAMKEWANCNKKTINTLALALGVLVTAVLILTYGNYMGGRG